LKEIYRSYKDTEVYKLVTNIKCPYCGEEWQEEDMDECGVTYTIKCDDDFGGGCGKLFKMHFDAD
jgi:hypothetical protein